MSPPKRQFNTFSLRLVLNSFGIWIASVLLNTVTIDGGLWSVLLVGLVLALVNSIIKPAVMILALPAILFSLGIFIVFINGLMVFLADALIPNLSVEGYGSAVLAGMVIGLVNYILTNITERGSEWKTSYE